MSFSTKFCPSSSFPFSMTSFARAVTFFFVNNVFMGVLMSLRAMSFCFFLFCASFSTKSQASGKNAAFFANDCVKSKSYRGSLNYRISFKAVFFGQYCRHIFNAFNLNFHRISTIELLLRFSRPFAIVWKVTSQIIFSVKRFATWSFTHIAYKIPKSLWSAVPPLTNKNTSPAVIFILRVVYVVTALMHTMPSCVKRVFCVTHKNSFALL